MFRTEAGDNGGDIIGGDSTGEDSIDLAHQRLLRSSEMIHPEIRALYSYWERLRGSRVCPERTEVDPRDIAGEGRHLFVLEDLGRGNIRFRLAGSGLLDAFGFDLRGMNARAIMAGRSRESFVAMISESIAEPGVGYARLLAPDGRSVWEVVLLPLRGGFGAIDRVIGCLHPVSGQAPEAGKVPLRFTIETMAIQPVATGEEAAGETREPAAGFAEEQEPFAPAERRGLRSIEGGRRRGHRTEGETPKLKIVKKKE